MLMAGAEQPLPTSNRACGIHLATVPTRPAYLILHCLFDTFRLLSIKYWASMLTFFTGIFNMLIIRKLHVEWSYFCHSGPTGMLWHENWILQWKNSWRSAYPGLLITAIGRAIDAPSPFLLCEIWIWSVQALRLLSALKGYYSKVIFTWYCARKDL